MRYENIHKGTFIKRPNRFVALVEIGGKEELVHVKNTGRCSEILTKGCTVYLNRQNGENRKTKYDLVAAEKVRRNLSPLLINIDSQIPNYAVEEWLKNSGLFSEEAIIKREVTYGNSRFDFYIEDKGEKIFLEVKGVTQEHDGVAMFPDAPTLRGVKHLKELTVCIADGYKAFVLFVIQMNEIKKFTPNDVIHKDFGDALRSASNAGVKLIAMDCDVTPDSMKIRNEVPIEL